MGIDMVLRVRVFVEEFDQLWHPDSPLGGFELVELVVHYKFQLLLDGRLGVLVH